MPFILSISCYGENNFQQRRYARKEIFATDRKHNETKNVFILKLQLEPIYGMKWHDINKKIKKKKNKKRKKEWKELKCRHLVTKTKMLRANCAYAKGVVTSWHLIVFLFLFFLLYFLHLDAVIYIFFFSLLFCLVPSIGKQISVSFGSVVIIAHVVH